MEGAATFAGDGMTTTGAASGEPLSKSVLREIGQNIFRCYQCIKCSSGCPLADQFDLKPNQVMRSLQFNDPQVLNSRAIWLCASCQTCATRCPQEIDVTGVMDSLRIEARKRGIKPAIPEIDKFNSLFLRFVKVLGRNYELGFMGAFNMARGTPFQDVGMGLELLKRGKLKLTPSIARTPKKVTPVTEADNKVAYYPGCSLESTAVEYDRTVRATAKVLGIELVEPKGWTCCGASSAHAVDHTLAAVMPMRTLSTVEQMGLDTVTSPCSACFARLKAAAHNVDNDAEMAAKVEAKIGYAFQGKVKVKHLLDTFLERTGLDEIKAKVPQPLKGLKVACYYGCLMTRPAKVTGAEHPEYPVNMDHLMSALGAEPVAWSGKTDCCGNSLSVTQTPVALELSRRILQNARDSGADAVVSMCPMCHMNLDARQMEIDLDREIPVFHATQLMALAFGLGPKAAALDMNLVDPRPLLGIS